ACRRGHDGRGAGARVLASAGAGDVGGAPREGRRGRDRQESLRVSRRGRMTEPRSDGEIAALVSRLLHELVGDDAIREGLARTPERVEKALRYLTSGYDKDVKDVLNDALFVEEYDEMVVVKDIDVFSLCEHHLLPFIGKVHVAYMPHKKIVGLS